MDTQNAKTRPVSKIKSALNTLMGTVLRTVEAIGTHFIAAALAT